jgi:high frequency lysogenization protein
MSNNQKIIDQCIALAGLTQAVRVVQHIAWKGATNDTDFKAVLASILRVNAKSAAAVYGGSFELSSGLRYLNNQLDPEHKDKDPEFVHLVINVISLQKQLQKNPILMTKLGEKTDQLSTKYLESEFYTDDTLFEELIESCSEAYKQTLSQLNNRIQVKGEPKYLKEEKNQLKVRAALLSAIRAVFLWRQSGGSRWHFLFNKKNLLETIRQLISNPIKE